MAHRVRDVARMLTILSAGLVAAPVLAFVPPRHAGGLAGKEFVRPELSIDTENVLLENVIPALATDPAWSRFFEEAGPDAVVYMDPRTGRPTNIIAHVPLLPGSGFGNPLSLAAIGDRFGQSLPGVDADLVRRVFRRWVEEHAEVLGIAPDELGAVRAARVGEQLWNISIPQEVDGIAVRGARIAAVINHGNLVIIGTSAWASVRIGTTPMLAASEALSIGLGYAGGEARLELARAPRLEIVPVETAEVHDGPLSEGLDHRLVWTFGVAQRGEDRDWELMVDARSGELLAFEDTSRPLERRIVGGVYPGTSTEICPSPVRCGVMQASQPMPFADTGLPAPDDFTNSAGVCGGSGGTLMTTLAGRYVRINDACGAIHESTMSDVLDLGGVTGQHDCVSAGASAGDTAAARSAFYEINKVIEAARGWLPANSWLQSQLRVNVNINATCGASYNPSAGTLNFYRSGSGCRNSGELAGAFDHEWGHGMDDNDAAGVLSNSTEAYADIAAIYRLETSCVGYGFYWTIDNGCGRTSDGTGFNANEAQSGGAHCNLDCSGVRDADFDRHADHTPDAPLNYVCGRCAPGSGPCGRQSHCAAAPSDQAAWDFVARDLQSPPFSSSPISAFIIANKTFYQGSGNIGLWHACTCGGSSNGCAAANAYMNWLAADDDNGNLGDGTPHMTALFSAFNRHGIACPIPIPVNSGCAGGPTTAPAVAVLAGSNGMQINWTATPGASKYWVLRTEGHVGCAGGMARIASVTGTSYTDHDVSSEGTYGYVVVAQGGSEACYGPASACAEAIPQACELGEVPDDAVWTTGGKVTLSWDAVPGASAYRVYEGDGATMAGLLTPAADSCLRWTGTGTISGPVLVANPDPGGVKWFLIVAADGACEGPAGSATAGPRILNSTGPCSGLAGRGSRLALASAPPRGRPRRRSPRPACG